MNILVKFVAVILTFISSSVNAYSETCEIVPVNLESVPPTSGTNKPHKSPIKDAIRLEINFDTDSNTLYFYDSNQNAVTYYIYNNVGECFFQGTCNFDANGHYSVLVPTTQNGTYTIYIIVNNTLYKGEFTITE